MKTNVIFKSGLNLVCDEVDVWSHLTFLYIHNVNDSKRIEFMNEALKNGWRCSYKDSSIHPKSLELSVKNEEVEQFTAAQ